MAKRKTAEDFQNDSFEAGYNTEPEIKELKDMEEETKEPQVAQEPEIDFEEIMMEILEKQNVRTTVTLSPLQKEMLRLCAFKEDKSYVTIYAEMFDMYFPEDSDVRKESLKRLIDEYKRKNG